MRDRILNQKVQSLYNIALYYDKIAKRPNAARESYEQFVQDFPKSDWTPEARERIVLLAAKPPDKPKKEDSSNE
jgi:outer membrane protein assembly factor BamD (BamD/ComL family)